MLFLTLLIPIHWPGLTQIKVTIQPHCAVTLPIATEKDALCAASTLFGLISCVARGHIDYTITESETYWRVHASYRDPRIRSTCPDATVYVCKQDASAFWQESRTVDCEQHEDGESRDRLSSKRTL